MKENILILSKTQMNDNRVCVGGLTYSGKFVRLLDSYGNNLPEDTKFAPRQVWEIDYIPKADIVPPHNEDVFIKNWEKKGKLNDKITVKQFIEKREVKIWRGHPDELFDRLIQWTHNGSGFIDKHGGIPNNSVGFWISDKDLKRQDYYGIRYNYPTANERRKIKFKGFIEPVDIIPSGTLLRVSLARWHSFEEEETPKCWLQLSGWYDLITNDDLQL